MKIRSAFFAIKNIFSGAWRGVRRAVVKLKTSSCRAAKSVVAAVLAFVMVASLFTTLDIAFPTVASAAESQTSSANIADFQETEFTNIQNAIFNKSYTTVQTPSTINELANYVDAGNSYFNWTDTSSLSLSAWDGSSSEVTAESSKKTIAGREYTVYNVDTPAKFRYVMELANGSESSGGGGGWPPSGGGQSSNESYIMLNLTADLDMNGATCNWDPIAASNSDSCFYLEGNGHTIYNLRTYDSSGSVGLFSDAPRYFVVKNLGFQSYMVLKYNNRDTGGQCGLLCGLVADKIYTYNVHAVGGYYQTGSSNTYGIGGLIGRQQGGYASSSSGEYEYGDSFIENCSVEEAIMYGYDHIGGLTSYIGAENTNCSLKYSECTVPDDAMEYATTQGKGTYPWVIENSYSTDCTIFSTGSDSGSFISCGSGVVCRNCYTNNTIYAQKNTAGFIGRIGTVNGGSCYDDANEKDINSYFENCYSTGVVEGSVAMGGFIGYDMGDHSTWSYVETINKDSNNNNRTSKSCNIYKNCYSTAMVGMDYAGKYCGGFVGYDGCSYSSSSVNVSDTTTSDIKSGNGSWYINCYAAGEVGNILTVTETVSDTSGEDSDGVAGEKIFFGASEDSNGDTTNHANNEDFGDTINLLEYYPTGGFAGVISLYAYNSNAGYNGTSCGGSGNFYNCFYDVQTSAMHEMAVGLANLTVSSSSESVAQGSAYFSLPGVTGIYTEESTTKGIAGLTDMPSQPGGDGTTTYAMDSNNSGSTTWSYCDQYYPQLSANMVSDTKQNDLNVITDDDLYVTDSEIKVWEKSVFYIPDSAVTYSYADGTVTATESKTTDYVVWDDILDSTDSDLSTWSKPVTSLAAVQDATSGKKKTISTSFSNLTAAAQMCEVIKAYRYSQASTSTVLLNHWDVLMNTETGKVASSNDDYAPGQTENELTKKTDETTGDYITYPINDVDQQVWTKTYKGLASGAYQFKVQQGTSWSFNYGDSYNGDNLTIKVPKNNCTVTIEFAYEKGNLRSDNYYVWAYIRDENSNLIDQNGKETTEAVVLHKPPEETYTETTYYVAGSFGSYGYTWDTTISDSPFIMTYDGTNDSGHHIYKWTYKLDSAEYAFKISTFSWGNSWGKSGVANGDNMFFTISETTTVTITFDEDTGKCTVTADPVDALTNTDLETETITFKGYSVIGSSTDLFGYKWYTDTSGLKNTDDACEAGEMTDRDNDGKYYVKTLEGVKVNTNYAYKVIIDGDDKNGTGNLQFYVEYSGESASKTVDITFTYDVSNNTASVSLVDSNDAEISLKNYAVFSTYGVSGSSALTGFDWKAKSKTDGDGGYTNNEGTMNSVTGGGYTKTYDNFTGGYLPAGTYAFKVVGGEDWDTGIDYGNPYTDDGNYHLTISKDVTSVTITFDPTNTAAVKISCTTEPADAIQIDEYEVTGTRILTKLMTGDDNETFLKGQSTQKMEWSNGDQVYTKTIKNVPVNDDSIAITSSSTVEPNYSYALKVIPYGSDQGRNKSFRLNGAAGATYDLVVKYNPTKSNLYEGTTIEVYASSDEDHTKNIADDEYGDTTILEYDPEMCFYSVLGDDNLTHNDWTQTAAGSEARLKGAIAGLMTDDNDDGIWELVTPFEVTDIPDSTSDPLQVSFKVAGNGTWDSGVDYGDEGDNYIISLSKPGDSYSDTCYVFITFNEKTKEITVAAWDNDEREGEEYQSYISAYDEDKFQWYIAAQSDFYENNFSSTTKTTVYDTVRDITSEFSFTYGLGSEERGLTVEKDTERNTAEGFHDTNYFTESYQLTDSERTVDISGEYYTDVIDLSVEAIEDSNYTGVESSPLLTHYYVEHFSPGKQWIKINTIGYGYSTAYKTWKEKYIHYNTYTAAKKIYDEKFELCMQAFSNVVQDGAYLTEDKLIPYLEKTKEADETNGTSIYKGIVENQLENYDILEKYAEITKMETDDWNNPPATTVTTGSQTVMGAREIRLIPTSYLEAGQDASINVLSSSSSSTVSNAVVYEGSQSTSGEEFTPNTNYFSTTTEGNTLDLDSISLGYYNYAATAAYLTTDKIGLGVYNNYNNARIITYNDSSDTMRDDSSFSLRNSNNDSTTGDNGSYNGTGTASDSDKKYRYFAMSSVYTESKSYDDDATGLEQKGLSIDDFKSQCLIGASYDATNLSTYTEKRATYTAKTIVKVFHVNTDSDGNKTTGAPVYFYTDAESTTNEYAVNYQKWSGLRKFTSDDVGEYEVVFYWTLNDGRYIQDSKYVTISVVEPGITKTVSTEYDTSGDDKEITYTITYTNEETSLMLDYAILDVLPFVGDQRDNTKTNVSYKSESSDDKISFNLKSIQVVPTGKSMVKEIYWTTSDNVRSWITTTDSGNKTVSNEKAAANLNMTVTDAEAKTADGYLTDSDDGTTWTALDAEACKNELLNYKSDEITVADYTSDKESPKATAIAITGIQLAQGESVEVKFTVTTDAQVSDEYDNNAFFYVRSSLDPTNTTKQATGMSKPVRTAIVSRNLSGFAWFDKDGDGVIDDGESRINGLVAKLYQVVTINGTTFYNDTGQAVTTGTSGNYKDGYYCFENISEGNYRVVFTAPDDGNVTVVDSSGTKTTVEFAKLAVSRSYNERSENTTDYLLTGLTTHNVAISDTTYIGTAESPVVSTKTISMPSNIAVYQTDADRVSSNVTFSPYLYSKVYQNVAFVSDNDYNYSLSVTKVANEDVNGDGVTDEDGEPLEGVKFMLEYFVPDSSFDATASPNDDGVTGTWYPVYFTTDNLGTVVMGDDKKTKAGLTEDQYIFPTDPNGLVDFSGLKEAYYRLTEVSTLDGYLKLESPIIIQLPYPVSTTVEDVSAVVSNADYTIGLDSDNLDKTENDYNYYKHVSMKLINQANQFTIPSSGANNDWLVMSIVGLVILTAAFTLFAISKKKRGDKKPS